MDRGSGCGRNAASTVRYHRRIRAGFRKAPRCERISDNLYEVDVGLLRRLALLAPTAFGEGNRLFTEFRGALSENYVLQALTNQLEAMPRYWSQINPSYEVDFIIQRENDIIPVEVKAEANTEAKSLKKYKEKYSDKVKLRVRFSLDNLKLDGDLLNIPLFMADYADRLIGMAMK